MDKKIIMKDNNLNELDSLTQTYGCRHSNPDICNNNGIIGKCAFVCDDCICKVPPKSWKRKYENLLKEKGNKKMIEEYTGFHLPHNAIIPDEVKFIISLIDENEDYYLYDDLKAMMFEEEIKQGKFPIFHPGMYARFQNTEELKTIYNGILDGTFTYEDIKRSYCTDNKNLNGVWNEQARDYFEFIAFTGLMPSYYKGLCSTENEKRYYVIETLKNFKRNIISYQDILFNMKFRNASKNYDNIEQKK